MRAFLVALTILFVSARIPNEISITQATFTPNCVSDITAVKLYVELSEPIPPDTPEIKAKLLDDVEMNCEFDINQTSFNCSLDNVTLLENTTEYTLDTIVINETEYPAPQAMFTVAPDANSFGTNEDQTFNYENPGPYFFKIVFENDVTNTYYSIAIETIEYTPKCEADTSNNNILLCEFSQTDIPIVEAEKTLKVTVTNVCGDTATFNLIIKKKTKISVKATPNFYSNCPDFTPLTIQLEIEVEGDNKITAKPILYLGPTDPENSEKSFIKCTITEGIVESCSGSPDMSVITDKANVKFTNIKDESGGVDFVLVVTGSVEYNENSFDILKGQSDLIVDYADSNKNYFTIGFMNSIKGIEEPDVLLSGKEVRCEISKDSESYLNCYPNEEDIPIGKYPVIVINSCGEQIEVFSIDVQRSQEKTLVNLGEPVIPFSTCMNINSKFSIEFSYKDKISNVTTPSVIFENDPNNYIDIECNQITPNTTEQKLVCDKVSFVLDDGETENEEFVLKRVIDQTQPNIGFTLTDSAKNTKIIFNENANPIVEPTNQKVNYHSDETKNFTIKFEKVLSKEQLPRVTVGENIVIPCEANDTVLTCTPNKDEVKPGDKGKEQEYKVAVSNQCGGVDELFSIFVSNSSSAFIKVTTVVFFLAALLF